MDKRNKELLGYTKPLLLPSKSLLTAIKVGYDVKDIPPSRKNHIDFIEGDSVITTISTGFLHNDKPVNSSKIIIDCEKPKEKNPESIIENIDTGFGCTNQLISDCLKQSVYKTHLCKENYLGEFKTESEKTLARTNLGVYSKLEIDKILNLIVINNGNFATKKEVLNMIANLDFVDSILKSYADYQIPNNLFKL